AELRGHPSRLDWMAVAFIVLAVGAGRGLLVPASIGLARVPENQLKFAVGVMLSALGVLWTGEGLGVAWPLGDLAIVVLAALFLGVALLAKVALKRPSRIAP